MANQAYRNTGGVQGMEASGVIRKYRLVKVSGDNTIAECDAEEASIGSSIDAAGASGDVIDVQVYGIAKVEAGGSVTAGDFVNADADGAVVSEAADAKNASGIAIFGGDSGDIISVKLIDAVLSV